MSEIYSQVKSGLKWARSLGGGAVDSGSLANCSESVKIINRCERTRNHD